MAADRLEIRFAHLEGAYEQIDKRLASVEGQLHDLRREMHSNFRWTMGLLILAIFSPIMLRFLAH